MAKKKKNVLASIKSLIGTKKPFIGTKKNAKGHILSTNARFPNDYYKTLWLSKKGYDNIAFVARVEGISFKKASELVVEKGFKEWIVEILRRQIEDSKNPDRPRIASRTIRILRRIIKEHNIPNKDII